MRRLGGRGWWLLRLNIFHAAMLPPSGGHILSSPAKKEYGKKDAAQGGVFPALRTHPLGWVSVVRVAWYGLPGKFASASVPCNPVSRPLAASLLLTHCGCSLGNFFWLAGFCVLIFSMQSGWRPPGAIFFLHRRRKNMERKTPRRAGCSPPYVPTPLGGCRWCGWLCFDYQADLSVHPCPGGR